MNRRDARDLRRLARYLGRHRWALAGAAAAAVCAAVFFGAAVGMVKPLMKVMVPPTAASAAAAVPAAAPDTLTPQLPEWAADLRWRGQELVAPARNWVLSRPIQRLPALIVILYALKALLFFAADYTFRKVGMKATADLREQLYARSLQQSDEFFLRHSTGEMLSRILGDVGRLQSVLGSDIGQMLQSIPAACVMMLLAFWQSWQVTTVCLIALPLFAVAAGKLGRRARKASRRSQEQSAVLVARLGEALLGRRVVQAYGAEEYETRRFGETLRQTLRQEFRVARVTAATPALMEILGSAALMVLILFAATMTRSGALDPKSVFVAIIALSVVFTHVRRIGQLNTTIQQALAAARRIFEVLDEPIRVQDPPAPRPLARFAQEIRFEGVSFDYGRGPVLHDVQLTIRAGEVHALVGASGAGKTTVAMLIPRFIDPTAGRVTIDGLDLRQAALADLRGQIALVSQETNLFDDTVAANIAYARSAVARRDIEQAARAAHADEFIRQLPEGYDTRLGERGSQLSAGQRQRLAIARAFLKNAPILILDEATSALDSVSEREVQNALEALLAGRTALIIAHRLSTVSRADTIHVVEAGRIIESGAHDELLAHGGAYARLHQLQQT